MISIGMHNWAAVAGVISVATCLLVCATSPVAAREIIVQPGAAKKASGNGPFGSIQSALEVAKPGDTIVVRKGTYREKIATVRSGPITIKGEAGASIVSPTPHKGRLFSIYHDRITLTGLSLSGGDILLYVFGGSNNRIRGNRFSDAGGECIRLRYQARRNVIEGNTISGCGRSGFNLGRSSKNGEGIYIGTAPEQLDRNAKEKVPKNAARGRPSATADNSGGNVVGGNTIDAPAECVDIKEGSSGNHVGSNACSGNRDPDSGGFSSRGNANAFIGNRIVGRIAGAGIRLGGDAERDGLSNIVMGNDLRNTGGYAIKDERSRQRRICGNTIGDNTHGISKSGVDPARPCS